jgi:hypothetical protein
MRDEDDDFGYGDSSVDGKYGNYLGDMSKKPKEDQDIENNERLKKAFDRLENTKESYRLPMKEWRNREKHTMGHYV